LFKREALETCAELLYIKLGVKDEQGVQNESAPKRTIIEEVQGHDLVTGFLCGEGGGCGEETHA